MPLKASSNDKAMWVTWGTPDEGVSTTFRINKSDPDEEVLAKLVRLTRFIASQMDQQATEIAELEQAIRGQSPAEAEKTSAATARTATPSSNPNAPRIPMPSPASLSDLPAGGLPPASHFGWADMPTTSVPEHLAKPEAGAWEMIPPNER